MRYNSLNQAEIFGTAAPKWACTTFIVFSISTLLAGAPRSDGLGPVTKDAERKNTAQSTRSLEPTAPPEVWLCTGAGVLDLLAPDAQWPFVREHLSGIQLYIDMIDRATPEQLRRLARLVRGQGYQVSVECGGTLDFAPMDDTNGEVSARIELAKLAKFYAVGGRVDFLNLDGSIRRLMHPHKRRDGQRFDSIESATD